MHNRHNQHQVALTFAIHEPDAPVRLHQVAADIVKIGRAPASHVRIDDAEAARMHAVIEATAVDSITLIDLGNGTKVNGVSVNKCKLQEGADIEIGKTRLVVQRIAHAAAERIEQALPIDSAPPSNKAPKLKDNPFAAASPFFVDPFAKDAPVADDAPEGSYEYQLVQAAPAVPADEIETTTDAVRVQISWGRNVLHVAHLDSKGSYYVGEHEEGAHKCDYVVPAVKLGVSRAPLVLGGKAILLPNATGEISDANGDSISLEEAIASGRARPCAELAGAHEVALENGTTVTLNVGDMQLEVCGEKRAKRAVLGLTAAALTGGALAYVVGSFVGHAGLLAAMAAFMPPLGATSDDSMTDDQRYFISQHMTDLADAEQEEREQEQLATNDTPGNEGGTGTAAKGESGTMGTASSKETGKRWAVEGDIDNPNPHIARQQALADAATFGMIGILNTGAGAVDSPTAEWGQDDAYGIDPLSANGNMWGDQIGDAHGAGGLGLTGIGEGGGGRGEGIGMGDIGTIGHGAGYGTGQGFGNGHGTGFIGRNHKTKSPLLRTGTSEVSGRLPPEVIQRIVRANYGRFRACYESALRTNPNLQGRVAVSFMIGRNGTVQAASASGDLPNGAVMSCVSQAFYGLSFPAPDGGTVRVTYPIVFSPVN